MIRITGGHVIDPTQGLDGAADVYMEGGRIVAAPPPGAAMETLDASGCLVMAGAIDAHSHIAGGNVALSRLLLPELHGDVEGGAGGWSAPEAGRLYAELGFTTVVEPAMAAPFAVQTHLDLADTPYIDRAALVTLGNDDFFLSLMRDKAGRDAVADYAAYAVTRAGALGMKCIAPGAAAAFKGGVRTFSLDDEVPAYGVSSRAIMNALQQAAADLKVPHPLHLHCCNLGATDAIDSITATIEAAGDLPLHLAHAQFYAYEPDAKKGLRSGVDRLIDAMARNPRVTIDVGQVVFGQTVTVSSDVMRQHAAHSYGSPKKWIVWEGEGDGGGIVPFKYSAGNYVNALQWAIGLEIFLRVDDPWRVLMTTDHPNGGPFTAYPQIIKLLMSRDERAKWIDKLPKAAMARTALPSLTREYTLAELVTMTRAAPARLLGLKDRGHLRPGAAADLAIYRRSADWAETFGRAEHVFKDGRPILRGGRLLGPSYGRSHALCLGGDRAMLARFGAWHEERFGAGPEIFALPGALRARALAEVRP